MTTGEWLLFVFVMIAVPATLIGVPIFVFMRGIQKFASKPLERCYHGLQIHPSTQPGDVSFVYHTYRGFAIGSESIDSMCPVSDAIAVWIREHPDHAVREILVDFTNVNYQWGDAPVACLLPFIRQGVEHFRFRASANSALALESLLGPMQLPWFSVERVPVHGAAAHDERPENRPQER